MDYSDSHVSPEPVTGGRTASNTGRLLGRGPRFATLLAATAGLAALTTRLFLLGHVGRGTGAACGGFSKRCPLGLPTGRPRGSGRAPSTRRRMYRERSPTAAMGTTVLRHGFELLAAKVGYDIRVSRGVALGPVVGADLDLFAWEGGNAFSRAEMGTFTYAGLQGRLDFGGARGGLPVEGVQAASESPTTVLPEPPSPPVGVAEPPQEATTPVRPSIAVSEDILAKCRLNLCSIEKAPKFELDRADLLPTDMDVLRQIAECFTIGPMKDEGLRLVGRADPRGSVAYDDRLGMRRADTAASGKGLSPPAGRT